MTSTENLTGMVPTEDGEYLRSGPSNEKRDLRQVEAFKLYLAELAVQNSQEESN